MNRKDFRAHGHSRPYPILKRAACVLDAPTTSKELLIGPLSSPLGDGFPLKIWDLTAPPAFRECGTRVATVTGLHASLKI